MKTRPPRLSTPLTIVGLVFRIIPGVAIVGYFLWMGQTISDNGGSKIDSFGPYVFAALMGTSALLGAVFWLMKSRAPRKQDIRIGALDDEAGDTTFDADAAIARYLEEKASAEPAASPRAVPAKSPPVFGKRRN
jgi:hypothetical protein